MREYLALAEARIAVDTGLVYIPNFILGRNTGKSNIHP